ncbi:hepatic lectin-like [Homarus americanus]|uniref:hepatic lectin-like n=1 Tax=Homarus americanus TaxID=6706 RepID=UPI001C45FC4B|nr:hepatic lectin-like [Homarus americanus]
MASLNCVLIIAMLAVASASACSPPFVDIDNRCYFFQHEMALTWGEARAYCQAMGDRVDLAVVDSCERLGLTWHFIVNNYGPHWYWIGATDAGHRGDWEWVTGYSVAIGTPFWYPNHPNAQGSCLALEHKTGYFVDFDCTVAGNFICENSIND